MYFCLKNHEVFQGDSLQRYQTLPRPILLKFSINKSVDEEVWFNRIKRDFILNFKDDKIMKRGDVDMRTTDVTEKWMDKKGI